MKKRVMLLVVIIVVLIPLIGKHLLRKKSLKTDSVFFGSEKYEKTFGEAVKGAKTFYDLYGEADEKEKIGDYDAAIALLTKSLPHVGISLEKGMVYKKLAEIYRQQGDLEKELFCVEEWPKYSMNQELNEEAKARAVEIKQLMATKQLK